MYIKNRPKPATLAIAAAVAIALITTLAVVVYRSSENDWHTSCTGFTPVTGTSTAVEAARQALLRAGHDPVLAVQVVDLDTCATAVSWKDDLAQPTASVVKLLIALDLLQRKGETSSGDENDIRAMLARSDDGVASRLWQSGGGPAIVTRQATALNLRHTRPPSAAGQWGDTVMSASDITAVYRHITGSLAAEERVLLTSALAQAPRTATDGFDQHFGIPDGLSGTDWAIKQGWGSSNGRRVLHSTGLVYSGGSYAVTLLSTWNKDVDWTTARSALTKAAAALRGAMSSPA
ncbi:serine hydrolase [Lentzea sp. E54]|uniref:serine hydrolase n=1 Tax=Lentzea xerophila TaxID=3435883 RepID=UPI003DA3A5D1